MTLPANDQAGDAATARDNEGGGIAAEYGVIAAFIAGVLAVAVVALGVRITGLFDLF